jgi:hypothetical protein
MSSQYTFTTNTTAAQLRFAKLDMPDGCWTMTASRYSGEITLTRITGGTSACTVMLNMPVALARIVGNELLNCVDAMDMARAPLKGKSQ